MYRAGTIKRKEIMSKRLEQMKIISRQMKKPLEEVVMISSVVNKRWRSRFLSRAKWTSTDKGFDIRGNFKYPKLNGCHLPHSIPRLVDL